MSKTHYRKVYKSDHLAIADLEDLMESGVKKLDFTIKEVKQEIDVVVAGRKGNHNIAYFKEKIKPMVINAGNGKIICRFANGSPFVEDWKNIPVTLYVDESVKLKGQVVGGIRIREVQPIKQVAQKTKPPFTEKMFEAAKNAKATTKTIRERYVMSVEIEKKYLKYVATK